jgi:hypothetical protein
LLPASVADNSCWPENTLLDEEIEHVEGSEFWQAKHNVTWNEYKEGFMTNIELDKTIACSRGIDKLKWKRDDDPYKKLHIPPF